MLLVVWPGAPSSVFARSSDALCYVRSFLLLLVRHLLLVAMHLFLVANLVTSSKNASSSMARSP